MSEFSRSRDNLGISAYLLSMTPAGLAPSDPAAPDAERDKGASAAAVPAPAEAPGTPHAAAEGPGPLLTAGFSADVYAISETQVLRRYRSGRDAGPEAELMRYALAHGFPVPKAVHVGGPDLVLERLHGPTLLQALAAGVTSLHEGAQIMTDLHDKLHRIPAPTSWAPSSPTDWPHVGGGDVVVHLDLHPGNIVLSEAHGPMLVDWANARTGTAALDVALSALILAEVAVDAGGEYSEAARVLLAAFLAGVHLDVRPVLNEAAHLRANDPALVAGERELLGEAVGLVRSMENVTRD
ncbi:Thiamine kinase [Cellulomonas sp. T2.31MG-18]